MKIVFIILICLSAFSLEKKVLEVAATNFPGLSVVKNQRPTGALIDILKEIETKTQYHFEIKFYPWVRSQSLAESSDVDILLGPYKSPAREKIYLFSESPILRDQVVLLSRFKTTWSGDNTKLKDMNIIHIRGWVNDPKYDKEIRAKKDYMAKDFATGIKMLDSQRTNYMIANKRSYLEMKKNGLIPDEIKILSPIISNQDLYMAFPRNAKGRVLKREIDELIKKYKLTKY